ncbi:hypothetical protein WJX72_012299 [[Myrmecia] bisecta]|uniref:Magnesium transporter n=1 Tax=[Myrmecia] bisecta TaxID=41462 RepID=A0AAW1QAE9_9CHLO
MLKAPGPSLIEHRELREARKRWCPLLWPALEVACLLVVSHFHRFIVWLAAPQTSNDVGRQEYVKVDKHTFVTELGVHYRDLRILDPLVPSPYPAAIFIREKALVINLEALRMIICKDEDLIARLATSNSAPLTVNSRNGMDKKLPFELRALESGLAAATKILDLEVVDLERQTLPSLQRLLRKVSREELESVRYCKASLKKMITRVGKVKEELEDILDDDQDMRDMYLGRRAVMEAQKEMDEEWRAQEDAQKAADAQEAERQRLYGRAVDRMRRSLDQAGPSTGSSAEPARDSGEAEAQAAAESMFRPGGGSPERDRQLAAMVKAAKGATDGKSQMGSSPLAPAASAPLEKHLAKPPTEARQLQSAATAPPSQFAADMEEPPNGSSSNHSWQQHLGKIAAMVNVLERIKSSAAPLVDPHDITSCENLLEAYFMQVDFLLSRLTHLSDRIQGTEDLINLELDQRRNELVALDLFMTAVMTMFGCVSMIGGIFGMNLRNGWEESETAFWTTTGVGSFLAMLFFAAILLFARYKRLMFIPDTRAIGS